MFRTITRFASTVGLVLLALPCATLEATSRATDAPLADPASLTNILPPDAALEQRPRIRVVEQVRSLQKQAPPLCVRVVPDLTGGSENAARDQLAKLNLQLDNVQSREVNRPKGTVVDQAPKAGTPVKCGSPVDIWVAVPVQSRGDDVRPNLSCVVPNLAGGALEDARR